MTLYKLPPMPWLQLNENLWQAITPLGTWEVTRDEELNWITECWATDTEVFIWGENCKDAEDGKRMAQAERDRILTESLEIAGAGEVAAWAETNTDYLKTHIDNLTHKLSVNPLY